MIIDGLLTNIENCPILVIYIIIQIVIQGYDIYERNFVAAFMHFWLGFIFYLYYKSELCSTIDGYLGIERLLIILAFVFCQIVLLRISSGINRVKIVDVKPIVKKEEPSFLNDSLKQYYETNVGNFDSEKYAKMNIFPNEQPDKFNTLFDNIKKYKLSRGTVLRLKDGRTLTITGFSNNKSELITEEGNFEFTEIHLDKSVVYNEKFIYVKIEDDENLLNLFNKKSNINDKIGVKERELKKRKDEIMKNISLLEKQLKKERQNLKNEINKKTNEVNNQLDKSIKDIEKIISDLERDLNKQKTISEKMINESKFLRNYRNEIINDVSNIEKKIKDL